MLVLGVHEMGHFLAARHHGIRATLPHFIPVPFGLGTFGAFIRMSGAVQTRRQLFDVGVADPLAGLAVAIPALVVGLRWSRVFPIGPGMGGPRGARTEDDATPLDGRRRALAWLSFAILALILLPLPHLLASGLGVHCPYV